jgi:hypothetical protein
MHSTISLVYTVRDFLIFTNGQKTAVFTLAAQPASAMKLANSHAIFIN